LSAWGLLEVISIIPGFLTLLSVSYLSFTRCAAYQQPPSYPLHRSTENHMKPLTTVSESSGSGILTIPPCFSARVRILRLLKAVRILRLYGRARQGEESEDAEDATLELAVGVRNIITIILCMTGAWGGLSRHLIPTAYSCEPRRRHISCPPGHRDPPACTGDQRIHHQTD
jgi:hypothetical protein